MSTLASNYLPHMLPLIAGLTGLLLAAAAAAVGYRVFRAAVVCVHFGEEPGAGRRSPGRARRRAFEALCAQSFACLFTIYLLERLEDVLSALTADSGGLIWVFQGLLLLGALFLGWSAANRWHYPDEDCI